MQSESIRKQVKAIWAVLAMLTLWMTVHTVKLNTIVPDFNSINKSLNILIERVNTIENLEDNFKETYEDVYKEQWEYEKELLNKQVEKDRRIANRNSFDSVFYEMREMYGPGALFVWNGNEYTTFYKEELTINQ